MGAWLARIPKTTPESFAARRVVYLGHLVSRQGVDILLDAASRLSRTGDLVAVDVIGTGDAEKRLRDQVSRLGIEETVTFHGFVADHTAVEHLLARCSLGIAPYRRDPSSFTRWADPGKLKSYVAAGLPIVMTDTPPNARDLADSGGAEIVADDPVALADAIGRALADEEQWARRRQAALRYAADFNWPNLLDPLLRELGFLR